MLLPTPRTVTLLLFVVIVFAIGGCQSPKPYFKTQGEPTLKGAREVINNDRLSAEQVIASLSLSEHVEGGYFKQTFKADHRPPIATQHGDRVTMTSIYYLLSAKSPIGHFHMNRSDIMHYFHLGDPITYYLIDEEGRLETHVLGPDPTKGHKMQMVVKGGTWKASKIPTNGKHGYGLIGEAVAPGFEYTDMQLGTRKALLHRFPTHSALIKQLTRQ